jgi:hypothetical protein
MISLLFGIIFVIVFLGDDEQRLRIIGTPRPACALLYTPNGNLEQSRIGKHMGVFRYLSSFGLVKVRPSPQ